MKGRFLATALCVMLVLAVGSVLFIQTPTTEEKEVAEYVGQLKAHFKDPSSMTIHGDILCNYADNGVVYAFMYGGSNSWGGYVTGKVEVWDFFGEVRILAPDDMFYTGVIETIPVYLGDDDIAKEFGSLEEFDVFDGKAIAKILGVNYTE